MIKFHTEGIANKKKVPTQTLYDLIFLRQRFLNFDIVEILTLLKSILFSNQITSILSITNVFNTSSKLLNDKNTAIFDLKYGKGFLTLVSGKGILKEEFGHVFLVMIVKLTWKQLFSFYGN